MRVNYKPAQRTAKRAKRSENRNRSWFRISYRFKPKNFLRLWNKTWTLWYNVTSSREWEESGGRSHTSLNVKLKPSYRSHGQAKSNESSKSKWIGVRRNLVKSLAKLRVSSLVSSLSSTSSEEQAMLANPSPPASLIVVGLTHAHNSPFKNPRCLSIVVSHKDWFVH